MPTATARTNGATSINPASASTARRRRSTSGGNVVDGSLARFIVFQSEDDYPEENEAAGIRTSPAELLDALRLIADGGGRQAAGNLAGMTPGPETAVDPLTVPLTPQARSLFHAFKRDNTAKLREARGTLYTAMLARIAENAWKVAMIRAVSADPVAPVIRAIDAEWAIALVRHCADHTMVEVERNVVADNPIEANHKRVFGIIRTAGEAGLAKNDLIRRTQFLDKRQRDDVIATLVEAGQIGTGMRETATKPAMVFPVVAGSTA